MQRKKTGIPSRIWSFGALEPTDGLDRLRDTLSRAHAYWNTLTRIELDRREAVREAEARMTEESRLRMEVVKKAATAARKTEKDAVAKEAITAQKRVDLSAIFGYAAIEKVNEEANLKAKQAQAESKLHFGTYLLINKAMEGAKTKKDPPTFRRWRENSGLMRGGREEMAEGRLGAHIMGGASEAELVTNQMLQIDWPTLPRDAKKWTVPRSVLRKGAHAVARIRASSDEKRKPIWVEFPVVIHRPLPPDARIKAAWLLCRYVGTRWRYDLQLQVESATFTAEKAVGRGTVAVDLCWRKRDGGIRIGYACDEAGQHREILMPEDVLIDLARADALKGHADDVFNNARDQLADDFGYLTLPEPVEKRFTALKMWRSPQRFVTAVTWWRGNRFEGDTDAFTSAWAFLQRWRHLYQYSTGVRRRALHRRKKYYEDIALQFCRRYAYVVLGDFDMRPTVELDQKAGDAPKGARHNRFAASPSEFRLVVKSTAARLGGSVKIVDCKKATLKCSKCGHEHDLDPFVVDFDCGGCGESWDHGHNHCTNLLKRASGSVPPKISRPLAPILPLVLAKPPAQRKIRDRASKRRSKTAA